MALSRRGRFWTAAALTCWLTAHGWLWTVLPPVPRWKLTGVAIPGLAFTADGRSLVTSDGNEVCVWDVASGRRERSWPRPAVWSDRLSGLVASPVERKVIVYDRQHNSPLLIDLDNGLRVALPPFAIDLEANAVAYLVQFVAFTPDGRTVVQSARLPEQDQYVLRLWDVATGTERLDSRRTCRRYAQLQHLGGRPDGGCLSPRHV